MNKNLISVILPVYNSELYITETIESILAQSYSYFELIIINDGSTDNTENCILKFKDDRIKYIKNDSNLKLIKTLNLGLSIAKGKYIARIDADDIALPHRFEKQIEFLENNSSYGIVGSFAQTFGSENKILKFIENDQDIRFALLSYNPFIHSSVLIRKTILTENNLHFDSNQLHVEDYDLWIKILMYSKGKILPEILIKYRIHENQISVVHNEIQKLNSFLIQQSYFSFLFNHIPENKFLSNFFFGNVFTIADVIKCLKLIKELQNNQNEVIVRKMIEYLVKKAKNYIFETKQLSLKEF